MLSPGTWLYIRSPQVASPQCLFVTQSFSCPDISNIYGVVKSKVFMETRAGKTESRSPIHPVYIFKANIYLVATTQKKIFFRIVFIIFRIFFCFPFITKTYLSSPLRVETNLNQARKMKARKT